MEKEKNNLNEIIADFIDYLAPELTPYEIAFYFFLLRHSIVKNNKNQVRIGKRSIVSQGFKGARGERTSYAHVTENVKKLEQKSCVEIGDTNRDGTLYTVKLPREIPLVIEKLSLTKNVDAVDDWFTSPDKRKELFSRDKWICHYCGEKVSLENATLDHYLPQFKGGKHTKENLKTSCLLCNSIKSGKTYEEASPLLLKNIQSRKAKSHK